MKGLFLVLAGVLAGCSSSSSSTPASLDSGPWIYQSNATHASTYTFNSDGTYTGSVLVVTSSSAANAYEEDGTFTQTATAITLTPTQTSCTGVSPIYTDQYVISGDHLTLTSAGGQTTFQLETSKTTYTTTFGCFGASGAFTPNPVAPVTGN